jgi:PhoPQ-activated pathogenicity-related protein
MIVFKEYPFLKIEVDSKSAVIIMTWNGLFSSAAYREATLTCLAAVKEYNLKYWLADTSNIDEIKADDQDWTNENILIPISEAGVKKVAIIIPENVYNHLAISSIMVKGKGRFKFDSQYFLNKREALTWFGIS